MNALVLLALLGTGQVITAPEKAGSEGTAVEKSAVKWLNDYGEGLKQAKLQGKPLLVVIDRPGDAVGHITQIAHTETKPADDLRNYVLCRVDADTEYGKAVAKVFEATALPHTAVIDKNGEYILFTKEGQFSGQEWATTLDTYRTGVRPVSYRSASEQVFSGNGSGSSYCPSCQRGR